MATTEPRCRRCGAPAAGLVAVSELDAGWAARPVGEWALCGLCLEDVAAAVGFERRRSASGWEVVRT